MLWVGFSKFNPEKYIDEIVDTHLLSLLGTTDVPIEFRETYKYNLIKTILAEGDSLMGDYGYAVNRPEYDPNAEYYLALMVYILICLYVGMIYKPRRRQARKSRRFWTGKNFKIVGD